VKPCGRNMTDAFAGSTKARQDRLEKRYAVAETVARVVSAVGQRSLAHRWLPPPRWPIPSLRVVRTRR